MALNLKTRLEKLEATAPAAAVNYCLVTHRPGIDCEQVKAEAIASYVEQYGCEPGPDHFIDIYLVAPAGSGPQTCACRSDEVPA
jgi:hypothetical protein